MFADRFSDMFAHFQEVYTAEKQTQARARENGNVVDATTGTSAKALDVPASIISD